MSTKSKRSVKRRNVLKKRSKIKEYVVVKPHIQSLIERIKNLEIPLEERMEISKLLYDDNDKLKTQHYIRKKMNLK